MKRHERERLTALLGPRIDPRFCPHTPHAKQLFCLSFDDRELFYGGAAGGGKSDLILMAFLQFIDLPHYRGLILRRSSVDLERSEAILDRAKSWWLRPGSGVTYAAKGKRFTFPSGATCEFGHANNVGDEERQFQGGAWHFVGFDELGQFAARQYLYLFSRLRRLKTEAGKPAIPLRMRGAGNPGGMLHNFLRDRFMSLDYAKAILSGTNPPAFLRDDSYADPETGEVDQCRRVFVPAKLKDNPSLDAKEYRGGLRQLDVVTREQLMAGNWVISAAGRYKPEWFERRFKHPGYDPGLAGYYKIANRDGSIWKVFHERDCYRFVTFDPAGTEREQNAIAKKKRDPSWSVASTWDIVPSGPGFMFWREVERIQGEFPDVVKMVCGVRDRQQPRAIFVEKDGIGRPYFQHLQDLGLPVVGITTAGKDKLVRAADATHESSEGRLFLPDYAPWLPALEAELFTWQGSSDEVCDQLDTLAYAAMLKVDGRLVGDIVFDL